ncbi:MAG: hypothetical protein ACO1PI_04155 [Bacteroidota bacterium]
MIFNALNKYKRTVRFVAAFLAFNLFVELLMPLRALALTGGPSQPEVQSFEPVSANQMVDPFTGDFTYNIPLLDVGGYPINISYHAGPSLDEEASWVGLGWNINPGVINRNMRGIPDDFWSPDPNVENSGNDYIKRVSKMKPSRTFGVNLSPSFEIFSKKPELGYERLFTLGIEYNNYRGFGFNFSGQPRGPFSFSFSSQSGFGVNVSLNKEIAKRGKNFVKTDESCGVEEEYTANVFTGNLSLAYNSREGIKGLGVGIGSTLHHKSKRKMENGAITESYINKDPKEISTSFNGSGSISFLSTTYIPSTENKSYNLSLSASVELGGKFLGLNPDSRIAISYNQSGKMERDWTRIHPVYGFLHHSQVENDFNGQREDGGSAIMDYNAYGRNMLTKSEVQLPYTVLTHDVLAVSGQGISGIYRAHSSMVGTVYEQNAENRSIPPLSVGVDLGVGNLAKFGIDVELGYFKSKSGRWEKNNELFEHLKYSKTRNGADFESVYFKNAGEKTSVDRTYFNAMDWGIAARPEMEKDLLVKDPFTAATGIKLKNQLKTWVNDPSVTAPIMRAKRDKRNQVITYLSAKDAFTFGLIKYKSPAAKDHHIGQITATNPDGSRYIYAQPAYNTLQKEYTFSFSDGGGTTGRSVDASKGLAWFLSGDETIANDLTLEKFFDYEETPAYAHSYLLNAVVSADYMDLTGNGPSLDDNGSYTHIQYKKRPFIYKWRTPYADNPTSSIYSATYQEGLKCDEEDDKASFVYGEKEIFYVETIKTKTHIALFYTSGREDALGVNSELGRQNKINKLQKLDSIQLFTNEEYYNNPLTRKPLKVVVFKYDYSLCPNVPNNSGEAVMEDGFNINQAKGKLTLTKIWFKYGNSEAGKFSPYNFYYTNNFDYGYKNYDRWGNYKASPTGAEPPNDEFPYTEQTEPNVDEYAAGWSLNKIVLPSGGEINVVYESDDYGYVQDKKAMEMFKIAGMGGGTDFSSGDDLYTDLGANQNEYIYFRRRSNADNINNYIPEPSPIDGKRYLYINAYVKLKTDVASVDYHEYVRTYAEIIESGVCTGTGNDIYGYVKIKKVPLNESIGVAYGEVNPIAKNAWQFMRLNAPHLVYEGQNAFRDRGQNGINFADIYNTGYAILGFIPELAKTIVGFNTTQLIYGNGDEIDINKSWIRLQTPELKKKGGGYRVKMVTVSNNWNDMVLSEEEQVLGQVYNYNFTDPETERTISSGVATYEPQLGGDEIPHRLPSFYTVKKLASLGQEDYFYNDVPLGESMFPAPMVGYRQVTVRNIKPQDLNSSSTEIIKRHGTGYTVQKFFTAYDFPVIAEKTTVDADFKKSPVLSLLGFSMEIAGATQGFAIELNDMNGKPKAMETFDEYDKLVSKTEYKYKTSTTNTKQLSNNVTTLKGDGTIDRDAVVGYEVEMVMHPKQLQEAGFNVNFNTDADVFFVGLLPVLTPGFGLKISGNYKLVRTATSTKIINRYGILESVTVTDQSSSVTTKNIAFDDETGEVLLTETTNEYKDKVYNFSYPAHWTYDLMGPAYKNADAFFSGVTISGGSGKATFASNGEFLVAGDELIADNGTSPAFTVWVLDKEVNGGGYDISFIDKNGTKIPNGTYSMRVLRSGRRNMQAVPVGKIVSNDNPVPTSGSSFLNGSGEVMMSNVINASAASFSDQWQTYRHDPGCWKKECEPISYDRIFSSEEPAEGMYCFFGWPLPPFTAFPKENDRVNPFVLGIRGNWRPDYTYVYYDRGNSTFKRQQTNTTSYPYTDYGAGFNGTNTASDGKLTSFKPFWFYSSGKWDNRGLNSSQTNNPWIWNAKANQINPDGVELENKNSLEIYSSAIYGFNNKQPMAVTYNAKLRETLFEGFEDYPIIDYNVLTCNTLTFNTELSSNFISDPVASKLVDVPMHWYFWPTLHQSPGGSIKTVITKQEAHTGKNSLQIISSSIKVPTQVYDKPSTTYNTGSQPLSGGTILTEYKVDAVDLTDIFSPSAGGPEKYLLTYWVKAENQAAASITIEYDNSPVSATLISTSPTIEGWKKYEYLIDLTGVTVTVGKIFDVIIANTAGTDAFFDDIRIHPFEANMKSFVYDNKKLRLMASLDENNYATFFEYDEEGNLVRTKRETERGIITINENRQNIKH